MQDKSFEPTGRHHHHRSDAAPWVFGGVLIVAGVFMLLRNMLGLDFGNWWSLFILIPAIGSLARAWQMYQVSGEVDEAVRGPLVAGLIMVFVFTMFFFGFNWSMMWPVLLIVAGLGALLGVFAGKK
jgi:hypothetical protein